MLGRQLAVLVGPRRGEVYGSPPATAAARAAWHGCSVTLGVPALTFGCSAGGGEKKRFAGTGSGGLLACVAPVFDHYEDHAAVGFSFCAAPSAWTLAGALTVTESQSAKLLRFLGRLRLTPRWGVIIPCVRLVRTARYR